ncbi:unnamed protein product, partial [Brachionus calyciflorus]
EYLNKFSYKNAIQDNLWHSLQQVSSGSEFKDVNLTSVLNTWTKQMGYPLVTVKLLNKTHISLSQEHFLYDPSLPVQESPYKYKWYIPFSFTQEHLTSSDKSKALDYNVSNIYKNINWINPNHSETIIKLEHEADNSTFILANMDAFGFFRINYDEFNWNRIKNQLLTNFKAIPSRMRSQLISDIFSLAQINRLESSKAFEFVEYLSKETEYIPWYLFQLKLSFYFDMVESSEIYGEFRSYILKLIEPIYKKIGWLDTNEDSWLNKKLRSLIISLACRLDYEDCVEKSIKSYKEWMKNEAINNIPKNLRSSVYCTAIKFGTYSEWLFASIQYDKETDSNAKRDLQKAMSCSKEKWIQLKYLNDQLNLNKTRKQDGLFGVRYSASNLYSNKVTWEFIRNNWNTLIDRYGSSMSFAYIVSDISAKFNTVNDYNEFITFFGNVSAHTATRQVKISNETIRANIKWMQNNYEKLKKWFQIQIKNDESNSEIINYRLPDNLKPYFYDLKIKPNFNLFKLYGNESFDGDVRINLTCLKPTNKIVLHQKNLQIQSFKINEDLQSQNDLDYDLQKDFLIIKLKTECIQNSKYSILIKYSGNLSDSLAGFYLSSYKDSNGNNNYLTTTQFEPTYARRAFPCLDEPGLKSEFKISIIRHRNFSSVSNMPLERSEFLSADYFIDIYEKSVPMSTYLVAFVISNFAKIEKKSPKYNVEVEIMARTESIQKGYGQFALDEAANMIDFFSDYFNTSYPLKKSTQIGIPDFNAGAMENWGLITYREKYLLYNPSYDSIGSKRFVSLIISHELAHQWFGNLVSPQWWNDLWLNEGFASWVEFLGINYTHPEWRDLDYFIVEKASSLIKDSLESSHPVSASVNDPSQINSIFDSISYDKGSCLVRMMNSFLTIDTFKKGIANYLKKYQFSNANQDFLWHELYQQALKDKKMNTSLTLKDIMDSWTLKKGYPVVNCKKIFENGQLKIKLEQKWFLLNPLSKSLNTSTHKKTKWFIPFTFTTKSNPIFDFESQPYWLNNNTDFTTIEINGSERDWIIGNIKFSGYYRVNYDEENWKLLIQQLNENYLAIDLINRAKLLDDSFNLARAEQLNIQIYFDLLMYLRNETQNVPFELAYNGIKFIDNMIANDDYYVYSKFKEFVKSLFKKSYERLAWSNQTSIQDTNLQILSIKVMCSYGHLDCIQKSRYYYERWTHYNESIPNDLRRTVLNTIAQYGSENEWFYMLEKAKNSKSYDTRIEIFKALTNTKEISQLNLLLKLSLNRSIIRGQDEDTIIIWVARNSIGKNLVWEYIMNKWDYFLKKTDAFEFIDSLFSYVLKNYNTNYDLQKIKHFFTSLDILDDLPSSNEIVESILINIRWMEMNCSKISAWLLNY